MMYDEFKKNPIWWLLDYILSPKTSDSYFVDMMYVEFMKNFLLADSRADGC